jgi:HD superfamily phosphodiesterase
MRVWYRSGILHDVSDAITIPVSKNHAVKQAKLKYSRFETSLQKHPDAVTGNYTIAQTHTF